MKGQGRGSIPQPDNVRQREFLYNLMGQFVLTFGSEPHQDHGALGISRLNVIRNREESDETNTMEKSLCHPTKQDTQFAVA